MNRNNTFTYGDVLHITLRMRNYIVARFVLDTAADYSELIGAVRFRMRHLHGLARMQVRNVTRGWCTERPIMLYKPLNPFACATAEAPAPEANAYEAFLASPARWL